MDKTKINLLLVIYFTVICTLFSPESNQSNAQTPGIFMSCVGNSSSPVLYALGSPLFFKSATTCFEVQGGLVALIGKRENGFFEMHCRTEQQFNQLGLSLYPNPVVNKTTVKVANTAPSNEFFSISIISSDGHYMQNIKDWGYNLSQGVQLDLSFLGKGIFTVTIESPNYFDSYTFIKAN